MIEYVGEHSFLGKFGNLLTIISAMAALFAAANYLLAHRKNEDSFRKLARIGFTVHSAALVGAVLVLFFMLFNLYFEYDYVWKHANRDMPLRYVFSCFWEGQEGSFLLWSFWHVILGNILMRTAKSWENLTMAVFSIIQVLLGSMVLGVFIFDIQIGNSPFTLIRELPENIGLPWTQMPNYLEAIPTFQNGRGLNPLLQNYWMTIHPPTLFLGYASTIVPFSFAIAGLLSGKHKEWLRPAIPWAFFSVSVLGIGILMGGAWAYEALSFGGFWAWDPVENASLIPWLTLVGGAHLMVVNQNKNNSLYATFFMILITYVLVMYASFLVHSGVLGDTSVHSFTSNGLMKQHLFILSFLTFLSVFALTQSRQLRLVFAGGTLFLLVVGIQFDMLVVAIITFLLMGVVISVVSYQKLFPKPKKEEPLWSREFWIFIGSLVFILSAAQILLETSKPIWNIIAQPFSGAILSLYELTDIQGFKSLAEGKLAPHSDRIGFFNKWQIPFAFIITFLIAFTQFLRYGKNQFSHFLKKIGLSFVISLIITVLSVLALEYEGDDFTLSVLLFTTVFAVVANFDYLLRMVKGKFDFAGPSVAHIGFGLVLLGALISTSKSIKISENSSRFNIEQLNEGFSNNEDILLFKGDTVPMGPYFVSYKDRSKKGVNVYYEVEYFDQEKRTYKAGDYALARGAIFEALEDHSPNEDGDFIMDQRKWNLVEDPRNVNLDELESWSPYKAGSKLFSLNPRIQLNPEFGNVAEPSTKRYFDKDIYTHVRWAELEVDSDDTGFRTPVELKLGVGDSAFVGSTLVRLNALSVVSDEDKERFMLAPNDLAVRASIGVRSTNGEVFEAEPLYILRDSVLPIPDPVIQDETGLRFNFEEIDPRTGSHTFLVSEHISNRKEFIVLQAIQFPMINILWLGCIMMFIGTVMAVRHRIKISKRRA